MSLQLYYDVTSHTVPSMANCDVITLNTSARELQIQDDIVTFDAFLRKSIFCFIDRYRKSDNLLIRYTVNSDYFLTSKYNVLSSLQSTTNYV